MKVYLSNGLNRFHLAPLAAELSRSNLLSELLVAGWPVGWQKKFASSFVSSPKIKRFMDRSEDIPETLIYSQPFVEVVQKLGSVLGKKSQMLQDKAEVTAMNAFSLQASKRLKLLGPEIYHFRSGYGGESILTAKKAGITTICDHSIAHPFLIDHLVEYQGSMPSEANKKAFMRPINQLIESDISAADHILVNSHFVKETCIKAGVPSEKISVVYLGVDDKYYRSMLKCSQLINKKVTSFLYAGTWTQRKGVKILMQVFSSYEHPIKLHVAGPLSANIGDDLESRTFFKKPNVTYCGVLSRTDLALKMLESTVFIFPSYCEGSARVIFEAMAAGCFIITTPNAGSIVQNGVHGLIVPPGDSYSLNKAIELAIGNPDLIRDIGAKNRNLVSEKYLQHQYCDNVCSLYNSLLD